MYSSAHKPRSVKQMCGASGKMQVVSAKPYNCMSDWRRWVLRSRLSPICFWMGDRNSSTGWLSHQAIRQHCSAVAYDIRVHTLGFPGSAIHSLAAAFISFAQHSAHISIPVKWFCRVILLKHVTVISKENLHRPLLKVLSIFHLRVTTAGWSALFTLNHSFHYS